MTPQEAGLPEGVGPHEGRELELMLAGEKPLAYFCDAVAADGIVPDGDFAPHVAAGTVVRWETVFHDPATGRPSVRLVYFALEGEAWRIEALHRIHRAVHTGARAATEADERETGRLLGYAEVDVERYLAHLRAWRG